MADTQVILETLDCGYVWRISIDGMDKKFFCTIEATTDGIIVIGDPKAVIRVFPELNAVCITGIDTPVVNEVSVRAVIAKHQNEIGGGELYAQAAEEFLTEEFLK